MELLIDAVPSKKYHSKYFNEQEHIQRIIIIHESYHYLYTDIC
jgi:hypothetical protein